MPRMRSREKLRNARKVDFDLTTAYRNFREDVQISEEDLSRHGAAPQRTICRCAAAPPREKVLLRWDDGGELRSEHQA